MSHNEFEQTMERIRKACTMVYRAEVSTYYNVSKESARELRAVLTGLENAEARMADDMPL